MKKLILILLPLSILAIACSPAQSDTNVTSTAPTEKAQNKQANTATVNLVSPEPQTEIPMGETEMILEVVDSNGNPVTVENLDISATMPMDGMEDMIGKVEVTPADEPGRFKATTYFGMQGTWNLVASVKDPQYQAQQEFTFEVK
ncbi:FixH protein [Xenococcus sp. PCC 7305]|uniref:FixH family protein n=1 Tax=Xenococcus sp. PCC 7305 TaxID=102125 RepID=UPI0002AC4804|nr:FixH family protein [Xenococcus sp. PCC 7305]ELS03266.1 FixH protein [Xenococcus sp. PCC 7305]